MYNNCVLKLCLFGFILLIVPNVLGAGINNETISQYILDATYTQTNDGSGYTYAQDFEILNITSNYVDTIAFKLSSITGQPHYNISICNQTAGNSTPTYPNQCYAFALNYAAIANSWNFVVSTKNWSLPQGNYSLIYQSIPNTGTSGVNFTQVRLGTASQPINHYNAKSSDFGSSWVEWQKGYTALYMIFNNIIQPYIANCTPPASGNWLVNLADNCSVNTTITLNEGNLSILDNGLGTFSILYPFRLFTNNFSILTNNSINYRANHQKFIIERLI